MLCRPLIPVPTQAPLVERTGLCVLVMRSLDYAHRLARALPRGGQLPCHPHLRNPPGRLARLIRGLRRAYVLLLILSGALRCVPGTARPPGSGTAPAASAAKARRARRRPSIRIDPHRPIGAIVRAICADLAIPPGHDLYPAALATLVTTPAEYSAALFGPSEHTTGRPQPAPDLLAGMDWITFSPRPSPAPQPARAAPRLALPVPWPTG